MKESRTIHLYLLCSDFIVLLWGKQGIQFLFHEVKPETSHFLVHKCEDLNCPWHLLLLIFFVRNANLILYFGYKHQFRDPKIFAMIYGLMLVSIVQEVVISVPKVRHHLLTLTKPFPIAHCLPASSVGVKEAIRYNVYFLGWLATSLKIKHVRQPSETADWILTLPFLYISP